MSRLEEQMKPVFERVFLNGASEITAEELSVAAKWSYLKICMIQRCYEPKHWAGPCEANAKKTLRDNWVRFAERNEIPCRVVLLRNGASTWGGHNYVVHAECDKDTKALLRFAFAGHFTLGPMSAIVANVDAVPSNPRAYTIAHPPPTSQRLAAPTVLSSVQDLDNILRRTGLTDEKFLTRRDTI